MLLIVFRDFCFCSFVAFGEKEFLGKRKSEVSVFFFEKEDGWPEAVIFPPFAPAPGPISSIQSECLKTCTLCSTIITECPELTISLRALTSRLISFMCNPVVGSSISKMLGNLFFESVPMYLTSFSLWDSPPESVFKGCPRVRYPRPTSCKSFSFLKVLGRLEKYLNASVTHKLRISATDRS